MELLTASALLRWTRDLAALLLWGGSLYLVLVPVALRPVIAKAWARSRRTALVALALAVPALLPVNAASLGRGWPDAFDAETLRALLFETTIGTAWMAQAAATVLLLASALLPEGSRRDGATAVGSGLLLAAFALTGHAAMREGWPGMAQRGNDVLHLLAGGFWLGALVPLLPTLRALSRPDLHRDATLALRRFSALGHGALAGVLATGLANAALVFGGWPADGSSAYLRLLVAKVALVAVMVLLATANRYRAVPRLAHHPAEAVASIRRATLAEIACGLGAVALVALFGLLEPG